MRISPHCVKPRHDIDKPTSAMSESCAAVDKQVGTQKGEVEVGSHGGEDNGDVAAARKISQPRMPIAKERAEHEFTQFPCRGWCGHCVRWQGSQ